jgi:hypothetical protein
MRNYHKLLVGRPEGRDHSEDLDAGRKIILSCIIGT